MNHKLLTSSKDLNWRTCSPIKDIMLFADRTKSDLLRLHFFLFSCLILNLIGTQGKVRSERNKTRNALMPARVLNERKRRIIKLEMLIKYETKQMNVVKLVVKGRNKKRNKRNKQNELLFMYDFQRWAGTTWTHLITNIKMREYTFRYERPG